MGSDVSSGLELKDELAKSFHEQFAQNQNHHQKLFLQVLTVLLTVLIGYGYLYVNVGHVQMGQAGNMSTNVLSPKILFIFMVVASILLSMVLSIILNMALGFRRDQLVACNIRVKAEAMGNGDGYFFDSFNPVKNIKTFNWIPGFHQIFYLSLLAIKCSLIISSCFNPSFSGETFATTLIDEVTLSVSWLTFIIDIWIFITYKRKWLSYVSKAPKQLKSPDSGHKQEDCYGFRKLFWRIYLKI